MNHRDLSGSWLFRALWFGGFLHIRFRVHMAFLAASSISFHRPSDPTSTPERLSVQPLQPSCFRPSGRSLQPQLHQPRHGGSQKPHQETQHRVWEKMACPGLPPPSSHGVHGPSPSRRLRRPSAKFRSTVQPRLRGRRIRLHLLPRGPFQEECGWRVYALERLQRRWSALVSSMLLGLVWGAWHAPLFLIPGTIQSQTPAWGFMILIVAGSILFTWVYNNTNNSILAVMLFHTMNNISLAVIPTLQATLGGLYLLVINVVLVFGVVLVYGPRTLRKET
ncbi:MAG: CPBP family intramembrane glutamic endopeptidase [Candidatus Caldarchaeum sp.]